MRARLLTVPLCLALASARADIGTVPQGTDLPRPLKEVGIDQRLNEQIPLDAVFTNELGAQVRLGQLLGKRPAVLALAYYECPMLCTMVLNGVLRAVRALTLSAGEDFDIIAISFDPSETPHLAGKKKAEYLERYNRPSARQGWHFLTGDQANIKRITEAAGFRYTRDTHTGQWAHASAIMVLTPEGRLARYFYGVEYSARDLRFGLIEASKGRIGTAVDQVLLYCFHYDPVTGKYGLIVMNILRGAATLVVAAIALFWIVSWRQGRRREFHHVTKSSVIS